MLEHEQFLSSITGNHHHHHHHHHHPSAHHNSAALHEQEDEVNKQQLEEQEHQHHLANSQQHQRPLQQSSPSDQSVSTGTPPHQVSRASPASTALVGGMSSNNLAGVTSRQLTPNSQGSSGTSNGGSSLGQQPQQHQSNMPQAPPNPMMRQFACHSKSMSAGVVVPVPGISSNLATATGMQQNMINNTIAANQHQQNHHHHHQPQQQQQQQQMHSTLHHASNSGGIQQHQMQQMHQMQGGTATSVSSRREARERRSHHHRSVSSQHQQQVDHHQASQHQQQTHHLQQMLPPCSTNHMESEQSFLDAQTNLGGGGSSSIILSKQNLNNNHNRSASTHLSSLILSQNNNNNNHHQYFNHRQPQASQRTHIGSDQLASHHHNSNHASQQPNFQVQNSIWSIDENLSKSQRKLTASGYLHPHSYLLNPSITDMSCDNVSTASRFMSGPGGRAGLDLNGGGVGGDLGGPTPGYYSHHAPASGVGGTLAAGGGGAGGAPAGGQPGVAPRTSLQAASGLSLKQAQFLPICDFMFNLISMVIYFCENVFGVIALIALYYHASNKYWALVGAAFVFASNFICQYLSLRWLFKMKLEECRRKREAQEELENEEECERRHYNNGNRVSASMRNYAQCGSCTWLPDGATEVQLKFLLSIALDAILHIFCLGFLVRYIKLVIPVSDTLRVKREARDLCMLRMIHGFVQSAPLLLLQSYMICSQNYANSIANLSTISVILSLLSVCWALASFTKYARRKYMHKFVLTWSGILSQLLWRLGTISSRVAALTIYAVYYNYWMLVVLALHWVTMFLWFVKPGNLLRDESNMSRSKRLSLAVGASWIYCFCYMNFEEHNSRTKWGIFYFIMFVENNLLFTMCQAFSAQVTWFKSLVILVIYLGFVFGMLFMLLYYKYFHFAVLNNDLASSQDSIDSIAERLSPAGKKIAGFKPGALRLKSEGSCGGGSHKLPISTRMSSKYNNGIMSATLRSGSHPEITRSASSQKPPYLTSTINPNLVLGP